MRQPTLRSRALPQFDHQVYNSGLFGYWARNVSTKPVLMNLSNPARSSLVKPCLPTFSFGRAKSISWWATFKSPQIITDLFFSKDFVYSKNAGSHCSKRNDSRDKSSLALGVYTFTKKNLSNSIVKILPSRLASLLRESIKLYLRAARRPLTFHEMRVIGILFIV